MPSPSTTRCLPGSTGTVPNRPRVLVIADPRDSGAAALAATLGQRGRVAVTVAGPEAFSRHRWVHRPTSGSIGPATLSTLAHTARTAPRARRDLPPSGSGPLLETGYAAILCRVATVSAGEGPSEGPDADYVAAEMHAVALSWLWERRDVVVNRPRPEALWGATPDLLWIAEAVRVAGIEVPGVLGAPAPAGHPPLPGPTIWREPLHSGRVRVLVAGDLVVGPPDWHEPLRRLAAELGLGWMEVVLARSASGGRGLVEQVLPVPALASDGHLAAAVHHLETMAARWTGGGP